METKSDYTVKFGITQSFLAAIYPTNKNNFLFTRKIVNYIPCATHNLFRLAFGVAANKFIVRIAQLAMRVSLSEFP